LFFRSLRVNLRCVCWWPKSAFVQLAAICSTKNKKNVQLTDEEFCALFVDVFFLP
jgi:hypothetical protein